MSQLSKRTFAIFTIIFTLLMLVSWYCIYSLYGKPLTNNLETLQSLQRRHISDSVKLKQYSETKASIEDSLMILNVENGWLSVELNRKEAELNKAINKYEKYRNEKEVDSALGVCDSIVYTYIPDYLQIDTTLKEGLQNTINLNNNLINVQDTLVKESAKVIDTLNRSLQSNIRSSPDNVKKKERRKLLSWGIVGTAIGVIIGSLFGN